LLRVDATPSAHSFSRPCAVRQTHHRRIRNSRESVQVDAERTRGGHTRYNSQRRNLWIELCQRRVFNTEMREGYNTYAHRIVRFREIVAHSFQDIRNLDHGIYDRIYSQKGVSTLSDKVATRQKQPVDAPNWSDIDARRSSAYWLEISSNVFGERSTRNKLWCNCELSNAAE